MSEQKNQYNNLLAQMKNAQQGIANQGGDITNYKQMISGYYDLLRNQGSTNPGSGDYSAARTALGDSANDTELSRQMYTKMLTDPSARGYDPATVNSMYGRQADALSGARTGFQKNMGSTLAAQGMTGTGAAMRGLMNYDKDYAANLRGAGRDVELANAEAKRSDLWNAGQGMLNTGQAMRDTSQGYQNLQNLQNQYQLSNMGLQSGALGQQGNALQLQQGLNSQYASYFPMMGQAIQGANQPGGWSDLFKSFMGGFGSSAGQQLGSRV
jgi:hypothetical protein